MGPFPYEFNPKFFREDSVVEKIYIYINRYFLSFKNNLAMQNVWENKRIFHNIFMISSIQIR